MSQDSRLHQDDDHGDDEVTFPQGLRSDSTAANDNFVEASEDLEAGAPDPDSRRRQRMTEDDLAALKRAEYMEQSLIAIAKQTSKFRAMPRVDSNKQVNTKQYLTHKAILEANARADKIVMFVKMSEDLKKINGAFPALSADEVVDLYEGSGGTYNYLFRLGEDDAPNIEQRLTYIRALNDGFVAVLTPYVLQVAPRILSELNDLDDPIRAAKILSCLDAILDPRSTKNLHVPIAVASLNAALSFTADDPRPALALIDDKRADLHRMGGSTYYPEQLARASLIGSLARSSALWAHRVGVYESQIPRDAPYEALRDRVINDAEDDARLQRLHASDKRKDKKSDDKKGPAKKQSSDSTETDKDHRDSKHRDGKHHEGRGNGARTGRGGGRGGYHNRKDDRHYRKNESRNDDKDDRKDETDPPPEQEESRAMAATNEPRGSQRKRDDSKKDRRSQSPDSRFGGARLSNKNRTFCVIQGDGKGSRRPDVLYIDSCCESSIVWNKNLLTDICPCDRLTTGVANQTVRCTKEGKLSFPLGDGFVLTIDNVGFIPQLGYNLISVSFLADCGFTVSLSYSPYLELPRPEGAIRFALERDGGLYALHANTPPQYIAGSSSLDFRPAIALITTSDQDTPQEPTREETPQEPTRLSSLAQAQVGMGPTPTRETSTRPFSAGDATATDKKIALYERLHLMFGHAPLRKIQQALALCRDAPRVGKIDVDALPPCHICLEAKQRRTNFPPLRPHKDGVTAPNQCWYIDCHPLGFEDVERNKFYTVFCDAFSRFLALFLHCNDDAETLLRHVQRLLTSMNFGPAATSRTIKFHVDNAQIYHGDSFQRYCEHNRITVEFTAPYHPHQNALAEAPGHFLESTARALLLQSGASEQLFTAALLHATWLKNRLPHASLPEGQTPFTLQFGIRPSLQHLHPFGCYAAVFQDKTARRSKASPAAEPAVYLGPGSLYNTHGALFYLTRIGKEVVTANYKVDPTDFPWKPAPSRPADYTLYGDDIDFDAAGSSDDDGLTVALPRHARSAESDSDWTPELPPQAQESRATVKTPGSRRTHTCSICGRKGHNKATCKQASASHFSSPSDDPGDSDDEDNFPAAATEGQGTNGRRLTTSSSDQSKLTDTTSGDQPRTLRSATRRSLMARSESTEGAMLIEMKKHAATTPVPDPHNDSKIEQSSIHPGLVEPRSVAEILRLPREQREAWLDAWADEWDNLVQHKAFVWDHPRADDEIISSQAVYKVKVHPDGTISKLKVRLCGRGDQMSLDHETFSPVTRLATMRYILSVAAQHNLHLDSLDVSGAYLNATLPPYIKVCMRPPAGFEHPEGKLMRLLKSLYGLTVSGLRWYVTIRDALIAIGFRVAGNDQTIFILTNKDKHRLVIHKDIEFLIILTIYVDDALIARNHRAALDALVEYLKGLGWGITVESPIRGFLGCRIEQDIEAGTVCVWQTQYIEKLAETFRISESRPQYTPLEPGLTFGERESEPASEENKLFYQRIIGALLWVAGVTRPDISHAVSVLSQFSSNPGKVHIKAAIRVARYLLTTKDLGLTYRHDADHNLQFYADASYGDRVDRRSSAGFTGMRSGAAVVWGACGLKEVVISVTEAELYALSMAAKEIAFFKNMLKEIAPDAHDSMYPLVLHGDNQASLRLAKGVGLSARTRHIDIRQQWIIYQVAIANVELKYVATSKNIADIFTKALPRPTFEQARSLLLGN